MSFQLGIPANLVAVKFTPKKSVLGLMAGFDPLQGQPLEPSGDAPAPAVPASSCPGALQGLSEVPTAVPG